MGYYFEGNDVDKYPEYYSEFDREKGIQY